jgi:hypothetical protein
MLFKGLKGNDSCAKEQALDQGPQTSASKELLTMPLKCKCDLLTLSLKGQMDGKIKSIIQL